MGNHEIVIDIKGIGSLNPFRYRGYYYDSETGLYYLKSRYYDPEVGRFINMDDIDYLDPENLNGLNLYAYCLNNPVMLTDSTGCGPILDFLTGYWNAIKDFGVGIWNAINDINDTINTILNDPWGTFLNIAGNMYSTAAKLFIPQYLLYTMYKDYQNGGMYGMGYGLGSYHIDAINLAITAYFVGPYLDYFAQTIQIGRIGGVWKGSGDPMRGYPGIRFQNPFTGNVYSIELQYGHSHGLHLQLNKWWLNYNKFPGQYIIGRSWRFPWWR